MTLSCDKCGEYVAEPFDVGDECFCGGRFRRSRSPFRGFATGCGYCAHLADALQAGECRAGAVRKWMQCGEAPARAGEGEAKP